MNNIYFNKYTKIIPEKKLNLRIAYVGWDSFGSAEYHSGSIATQKTTEIV